MSYIPGLLIAYLFGAQPATAPAEEIRLVVRGDDMGCTHTANVACLQAYRGGIVRTVEVMVPGPWFNEAARMLSECPDLDVGVHLTLTSEWENCRWGPVTAAPSLIDPTGRFFPMTRQRADFPPGIGFVEAQPDLREVERELRTQIEIARRAIPRVSHLSAHMGTPTATRPLAQLTARLAKEYGLPLELPQATVAGWLGGQDTSPERKEAAMLEITENLRPGLWVLIDHPGLDTPEMQGLGHKGYTKVAADRAGVTFALCSAKVKQAIARRHVRLWSYREAWQHATTVPASRSVRSSAP